ncbi:hypothetical protein PVL29_001078 [Vitis rotundifolia]|uniref:Uncharacterized protein n=2 Tax=Vitis rotundifolia TaxID=103349 RepID=A0AA39ALK8_VITRO|nr:hypothetical protein PVL29_001078 [Vitis rotundifolia]
MQPRELPGFYYDVEKNRYFPIKAPIPGSSSSSTRLNKPPSLPKSGNNICKRIGIRAAKLLRSRELHGDVIPSKKGKCNFEEEYLKVLASQPLVWKYQETDRIGDGALEQISTDINTSDGQSPKDLLLTGGVNGYLSLYEVAKVGQHFDYGVKCMPDRVWPPVIGKQTECSKAVGHIWRPTGASLVMQSSISCIKMVGKHSPCTIDDRSAIQHVLITTLGSETIGGSVYILNLTRPLDFNSIPIIRQRMHEVASFNCTIWTADCNSKGSQAVIGTNVGVALVNMETRVPSWVCRTKSDVLSLQLDQSGNVVLCGLRNGAVVTVDVREKQEGAYARHTRHRVPYPSHRMSEASSRTVQKFSKQWFELKGKIYPESTIFLPSSISCLLSLQLYDQYFLASSMDGSMKLYDHRLIQRGAVQSYEGHVNSHTRIQLGVDPSERFVFSGGEDHNFRIWSIKSGELLFEDKFSNSVPLTLCWEQTQRVLDGTRQHGQMHSWSAWIGSEEGVFRMQW